MKISDHFTKFLEDCPMVMRTFSNIFRKFSATKKLPKITEENPKKIRFLPVGKIRSGFQ